MSNKYKYAFDNHPILDRKTESVLLTNYCTNKCQRSKDTIVLHNLKFAAKIAYTMHTTKYRNIPIEDIVGYALMGLIKAVEKYDIQYLKTVKFSSHSVWWIRQEITRQIEDNEQMIRLPASQLTRIRAMFKSDEFKNTQQLPDQMTVDLQNSSGDTSIDISVGVNETISLVDIYSMNEFDGDELVTDIDAGVVRETIMDSINGFTARDKSVIELLYGLHSNIPMSMREVGAELRISHEQVRKIKLKCFKSMKHSLNHIRA
jgi:RNA polymerase primary sigma factor